MSQREAAWGILTVLDHQLRHGDAHHHRRARLRSARVHARRRSAAWDRPIAGRIAAELGIGRILIPRDPGTFSAWGMLVTDVHQERSITRITQLDDGQRLRTIEAIFRDIEDKALADLLREKFPRERFQTVRQAGMRYRRPILRGRRAGSGDRRPGRHRGV